MNFVDVILAYYGSAGRQWLDALPAQLATYAERWNLTLSAPFENLSYNYVAPVQRADGTPAVLKVGFPNDELRTEIAAIQHFDGQGMARLLEADSENCAMLLEHVMPGETLWDADEEFATFQLLEVMPKLWKPYHGVYPFKTVAEWGLGFARMRERYNGQTGPIEATLFEKAEARFF